MYYKVIKDDRVIDVIDNLVYLKWQPRNKIMLLSKPKDAQAFLSSDGNTVWRDELLNELPESAPKYDIVKLIEIDKYEYEQLKILNLKSPQEIVDALLLELLSKGVI